MARFALNGMFDSTDALLARTEHPLHRKILIKLAPEDVLTPAEAVRILTPVLAATPAR